MGCGGGPWVLALLSTEALIFYYKEKNSNRDLEEGRDRRRLKLLTLTDYGKEQDMGIEALEAMLMDDEFRGKLKLLEDCTATPDPDCGCSRGLHQLFDSYCYGDGSNHLIFVTRTK
eukprot:XP_024438260.1 uncharacterized protein LOC112323296 isoform X2 [Populus trichocarpa]